MLAHAGFSERGQVAFIVLVAAALLALAALDPESLLSGLRQPIVLVLLALALLTATSAAWTIGEPAEALRWGAVVAGYAGIALTGYVAVRRGGVLPAALLLVGLAGATGLIGLVAAAIQEQPFAERIGGAWRPGGLFEYPPALGALQLAAIPLSLRWMAGSGRCLAVGASSLAVGAATIALISSRAILALGAVLLLAVALWPQRTVGSGRPLALAAIAFALTVGGAADAIAGSYADPYVGTSDLPRILGLALMLPAAVGLWLALRNCFDGGGEPRAGLRSRALGLALLPMTAALTAAALTPDGGTAVEPDSGITHGRVEVWGDAVSTAVHGPAEGSGALTFATASFAYQDPPRSRFAHNILLEEWVELGYAGLALSLAVIGIGIALVIRSRGTPAAWLLGPGAIAYLVASLVDWPWRVPASAAIFAFILGALAANPTVPGAIGSARRHFDRGVSHGPSGVPRDQPQDLG